MELRRDAGTGVVTASRFYRNAVRTTTGGLVWMCGDQHGTGQLAINAATLSASRRKALPYGETRGTPPASWPDQHGFVGGTQDPTGLTHLGAREYDPTLGRFVSVDPIVDPGDPQQMHGYTYANNSPTTSSDPSGLRNEAVPGDSPGHGNPGKPQPNPARDRNGDGRPDRHCTTRWDCDTYDRQDAPPATTIEVDGVAFDGDPVAFDQALSALAYEKRMD